MKGMYIRELSIAVSIYPVTNQEWFNVLNDGIKDNKPKVNVRPLEIAMFCNTLSFQKGLSYCYLRPEKIDYTCGGYRLLTKEEWEYCASAGGDTELYSGTDDIWELTQYASIDYSEVGLLKPNKFGLYDMSGNVDEWIDGGLVKEADEHIKQTISRPVSSFTNLSKLGFRVCRYIIDPNNL